MHGVFGGTLVGSQQAAQLDVEQTPGIPGGGEGEGGGGVGGGGDGEGGGSEGGGGEDGGGEGGSGTRHAQSPACEHMRPSSLIEPQQHWVCPPGRRWHSAPQQVPQDAAQHTWP